MVFGVRVTTEDNYFVLEMGPGCTKGKKDLPGGEVLDLDDLRLSLRHGRPTKQLLSTCGRTVASRLR